MRSRKDVRSNRIGNPFHQQKRERSMISLSLAGKVALVSGGSRGIGRATATQLAQAGAKVAIGYRGDEAAAREVVASIQKANGTAVAIAAELSVWEQARLLVAKCCDRLGGLDILVVHHR